MDTSSQPTVLWHWSTVNALIEEARAKILRIPNREEFQTQPGLFGGIHNIKVVELAPIFSLPVSLSGTDAEHGGVSFTRPTPVWQQLSKDSFPAILSGAGLERANVIGVIGPLVRVL